MDELKRVEELHAFYTLRGKSFCGEQAAGHVLELCDIARKALEERDRLTAEVDQLKSLEDFWAQVGTEPIRGNIARQEKITALEAERDALERECQATADGQMRWVKLHDEEYKKNARLQRRLEEAEKLINEIRPRPSGCREYDDTCWACRAVKWMEDKQDDS